MSERVSTVREYFDRLAEAFAGSDPAVAQDAIYDAREFLAAEREALEGEGRDPGDQAELVERLRRRFGEPAEVVESYRATEAKVAAALASPAPRTAETAVGRIFSVFLEPHSYGALFFMLLSLPLGTLYFTWAVTGLSLSLSLAILIFGLPFFLFFMATVRAGALIECRLVETLLGERMPRRPADLGPEGTWLERARFWLTDGRTWMTILYMILQLPLGVVYFTVATILLSLSTAFLVTPFAQLLVTFPIVHLLGMSYYLPFWAFPFFWLAGALDLLLLMHIARGIGRLHARMAKSMLARPGTQSG